ncbi:MAG: DUF4349 domain-containing protein [Eubacteriales bacterium]
MLKKLRILAIFLSLIFILSGCSSASTSSTTNAAAQTDNYAGAKTDEGGAEPASTTTAAAAPNGDAVILDPGNVADSGKKIIYTVNMALEAENASNAITDIGNKAAELGGYVSNSSYNQYENSAQGSITVRIPPDKLKEFTEHVGTIGDVLSSSMGSQDVTAQYVDIQSRLTNAQAQEAQLLAIMAQAVKIEDILNVRQQLDSVQMQIEEYKGQLRLMDNQVGYSTVTITITQPTPPPVTPEADKNSGLLARWSFDYIWQNVQKGFSNSLSFTVNALGVIFIAISYMIIPIIIIGIVVVVIIVCVKRSKKKKNQRKQP